MNVMSQEVKYTLLAKHPMHLSMLKLMKPLYAWNVLICPMVHNWYKQIDS